MICKHVGYQTVKTSNRMATHCTWPLRHSRGQTKAPREDPERDRGLVANLTSMGPTERFRFRYRPLLDQAAYQPARVKM